MNYNNFIIGIILLAIPLILLILCYRRSVYQYCNNNIKCDYNKFVNNLNKLEEKKENIEHFLGWWATKDANNNNITIPPTPLNLTKSIGKEDIKLSNKFPPLEGDTDFKDADNKDLLKNIGAEPINKNIVSGVNDKSSLEGINGLYKNVDIKKDNKEIKSSSVDIKSLFSKCNFFNEKCPDKYHQLGNFAINGSSSNMTLTCGNVQNVKPAKAIARIKNGSIYEIDIVDHGHGYFPDKPPKVTISSGNGHGATAESIVDDNGFLKIINVIKPGYNYTETPDIIIDSPYMNSSCFLCCKDE